ncbi:hypothetical protein I2492_06020 [Budviciaceae bacterium CWB-B4]|uniref:Phage protein n=1 Tax=Limnobaculum xujianqingii TaxID=2738837 RepID=A0A9D7AGV9_9GAMM|nr:hypothetical protein [Limnobaculum xujianqingii]MBK5072565.1 hypothetical protein [Limnobaculum xujianqingii]MBK5175874.1 hypothetical protein [Limnobaculum xujianqingii]
MAKFTGREFLKELAVIRRALRADIKAHSTGLDTSPEAIKERRKRVLNGDFTFFAYTYFPHHIRGEPSLFHAHFCKRYPQLLQRTTGCSEWWIAPRGEAKSSLLTKIGPVWCTVQALHQRDDVRQELALTGERPLFIDYIILLGAETKLPSKLLEVVKTELIVNSALALDFPEICGKGPVWKIGEFVTVSGVKIESFGAEQAIRGTFHGASRPKLLLGDDLITDAEAKSPTERENRWNWLSKAIDYLGPPDGSVKYMGVGTVLDKDDPISRAKRTIGHVVHHFRAIVTYPKRMDLWDKCQEIMLNEDKQAQEQAKELELDLPDDKLPSYRFYLKNKTEMDEDAVTSWPAVRPLYWLMRQRAKNSRAFSTEMQGDPRTDEDRTFTNIQFYVQTWREWLIFGACDPSMGKGQKADPSSIIVGGYDLYKRKLNVMEAESKRRLPSKIEADLIRIQRQFKCQAIGFENNNAYEHSRQTFVQAGLREGVALPLVGVTASVPLEVRVDSLEPFVNDRFNPRILFHPGLVSLLAQLEEWPEPQSGHHYDNLSALHILWMIAVSRSVGFEWQSIGNTQSRHNNAHSDFDDDDAMDDDGGFGLRW